MALHSPRQRYSPPKRFLHLIGLGSSVHNVRIFLSIRYNGVQFMVAPFLFNIEKCTCGRVYETELLYEVPEIEEEERKK